MAIFRCKSCGGDLDVKDGVSVVECEYCGNKQTLPKVTDENLQALFNRANFLRQKCEFDKAEKLYEKILEQDDKEAEAYWGVILCKFGIEYVKDPGTENMIPTCHRASYDSIVADDYYKQAVKYADVIQRPVYEAEAKKIDGIQKQILEISRKEKPYDVFICYKETDENGQRTHDSVMANDIYYQLTQEGFKVFYAAITLEGKLGSAYEPIIFAALNSAKVMLVVGSKPEYFQATWVRNEWSRYLHIMKKDRSRLLIPCYSGMDAYDLPEEFAHLQAQDMSKIGFINDLVRGIKKVIVKEEPKAAHAPAAAATAPASNVAPLIKRAFMFLEDGEFDRADELCEQVLNQDPENAMAYVAKLMVDRKVRKMSGLEMLPTTFDNELNYKKAMRFGDESLKESLKGYNDAILRRNAMAQKEKVYAEADNLVRSANATPENYRRAAQLFASIKGYKDSEARSAKCIETANEKIYQEACKLMKNDFASDYLEAAELFEDIKGYKDADRLAKECEALAVEADYKDAVSDMNDAKTYSEYSLAAKAFEELGNYKDSPAKAKECRDLAAKAGKEEAYQDAVANMSGTYSIDTLNRAIKAFETLGNYKDSQSRITQCNKLQTALYKNMEKSRRAEKAKKIRKRIIIWTVVIAFISLVAFMAYYDEAADNKKYKEAQALMEAGEYEQAIEIFSQLNGHKKSNQLIQESKTNLVIRTFGEGKISEAEQMMADTDFGDRMNDVIYAQAKAYLKADNYGRAYELFRNLGEFSDSQTKLTEIRQAAYAKLQALVAEGKYQEAYEIIGPIEFTEEELSYEARNIIECLANNDYRGAVRSGLEDVVIPEGVTDISGFFYDCENLKSVKLPSTLTSIGASAFRNCTSLTSITIPAGVTVIDDSAFEGCIALTDVVIPETVTEIQIEAFRGCTALAKISIPAGVTAIGESAFRGCTGLGNVTLPSALDTLGHYAFYDCSAFTSVTVPSSVTWMGQQIFRGCTALEEITVPFVGEYADETGSRYFDHIFYELPESLKTVVVTGGTTIGDSAFEGCAGLTKIVLPDTITEIHVEAFRGCASLPSITIPASVTVIGDSAFNGCTSLGNVTLPSGLTKLGHYAFYNCASFTSVTVPSSVTWIGKQVFRGCIALEEITVPFVGEYSNSEGERYFSHIFYEVPASLKKVVVTGGNTLADSAFKNLKYITSVTLPDAITKIGNNAFAGCSSLANINIPNQLKQIGDSAFSGCSSLTSITLPASLSAINPKAFENCYKLVEIYNLSNMQLALGAEDQGFVAKHAKVIHKTTDESSILFVNGDYLFMNDGGENVLLTYVGNSDVLVLPESVNGTSYKIADYAFYSNPTLAEVTIPAGVTAIGDYAFYNCSALTKLIVGDGVKSIGYEAFYDCVSLVDVTLGASLTSIGEGAFRGSKKLEYVRLPATLTKIDKNAFYNTALSIAEFENTIGWETSNRVDFSSNVNSVSSSDLTNSGTMAAKLKSSDTYWRRTV